MEPVTRGISDLPVRSNSPGIPAGFSLLELLVVMAMISILLMLVMPAVSVLNSSKLTQSGQIVADQINLARQMASSRNRNVEVRLIENDASAGGYAAVQLWAAKAPLSDALPAGRMESFPSGVVISKDSALLSQLLKHAITGIMPTATTAANAPYAAFSITPSGLVCSGNSPLADDGSAYLTVIASQHASVTTPPPNFVTVQINPLTGTSRIYRP